MAGPTYTVVENPFKKITPETKKKLKLGLTVGLIAVIAIILLSWGMALLEYSFMIPANRIGSQITGGPFSLMQLKIIQECISLFVFTVIVATVFKGEPIRWNHLVSFGFIILAVFFAFMKTK